MIMALNPQESFQTGGMLPETILQLQRLVLLNLDSRDAFLAAADLSTDARVAGIVEQIALERRHQAATLQNILWCHGKESEFRRCRGSLRSLPFQFERDQASAGSTTEILQGLLDIDEYVVLSYENILKTFQGRGIRQLLCEQAVQIQHNQIELRELQNGLAAAVASATN
jgi:hypothetical protein